jgi:nitrogen fixation protein NifQ
MFLPFTDSDPAAPAPCIVVPPDDLPEFDSPDAIYQRLMDCSDPDDRFDHHVVACILALAAWEADADEKSLVATTGLDQTDLATMINGLFPHAVDLFLPHPDAPLLRTADETCLLDLLVQCATDGTTFQAWLAAMIARRAQSPNHLWQDLGLRNRGDLSRLMTRHFRPLAARNSSDMKWKKFLYRMICRDAGYSICTAPSCGECTDFEYCFGDESGESRLARVRRSSDLSDDATSVAAPA